MTETTPIKDDKATPTATTEGPSYPKIIAIALVMLIFGTGVAYVSLLLGGGKDLLETKIEILKSMDLQWLYLALVVLGRTICILNFVPTNYKRGLKGNIRSNPFFYQTNDDAKTTVVFQTEGPIGRYNRSNRSIQHMIENSGFFFAAIGPVGWLFPKQTLVFVLLFCASRIVHQKGYATGYGSHAIGFVISLLSIVTLEGLALIAFLKGQEVL